MRFRRTRETLPLFILGFVCICLFFAIVQKQQSIRVGASNEASATMADNGEHFISIYDNGVKTTFRSDALTVEDVIKRANITITDGDIIEPALDEQIDGVEFFINIYRAREVVVVDGVAEQVVRTASSDPYTIAEEAGVKLLDADRVDVMPYDKFLETGYRSAYQVTRAKTVNLDFSGKKSQIRTQSDTIKDFLAEQGIEDDSEKIWFSQRSEEPIIDNMKLSIYYQGLQTITVEEDVPFTTKTTYDFSLDYGKTDVKQKGQNGKKSVVYEINMRDGKVLSKKQLSSVVTKQPVEQLVTVGRKVNLPAGTHTDWMAQAGISASDYGYVQYIIERESHWNPIAENRYSGAYGLCQALPGSKMGSAGSDWRTNPITQLRWCNGYATGRYGSWAKAYEFWITNKWW